MSAISIEVAIEHLRAEDDDREFIQGLLDAAEEAACNFMARRVYEDAPALVAGRAAAVELRAQARVGYSTAIASAGLVYDEDDRLSAMEIAGYELKDAITQSEAMSLGIVLTPVIQAACLLILGHLYTNREDVVAGAGTMTAVALPQGSKFLLAPYRVQMGV
ncbi:head-tail connector protein [Pseudomonas sp. PS02290]|uniref:head-tail connector protein n=1 Tax=Pseudomonas sp. PS02290 TaxID=2991430 RepID=UPI00249C07C9|nr:head-tail connector protein [Pseudomonas sp. PS02290]